jgi:hypothetical protein
MVRNAGNTPAKDGLSRRHRDAGNVNAEGTLREAASDVHSFLDDSRIDEFLMHRSPCDLRQRRRKLGRVAQAGFEDLSACSRGRPPQSEAKSNS